MAVIRGSCGGGYGRDLAGMCTLVDLGLRVGGSTSISFTLNCKQHLADILLSRYRVIM